MKTVMHTVCLLLFSALISAFKPVEKDPEAIYFPEKSTSVVHLAAQEVQKYIYQRTGKLLPVKTYKNGYVPKFSIVMACDSSKWGTEDFSLEISNSKLLIQGGSDIAVLYGAYQYVELLGVRFSLHGDILPDEPYHGSLYQCGKKNYKPLFSIRGLLPFHDFPDGPDYRTMQF